MAKGHFINLRISSQACEKLGGKMEKTADGVDLHFPAVDLDTRFLADFLIEQADFSPAEVDEVIGNIFDIGTRKTLMKLIQLSR